MTWWQQALSAIILGIAKAWFEYIDKKLSAPNTLQDAKTPDKIRAAWDAWIAERLRNNKGSDSH